MATRKNASSQKGFPKAHVGGYRAPVDPSGMDDEMKRTMGVGRIGGIKPRAERRDTTGAKMPKRRGPR